MDSRIVGSSKRCCSGQYNNLPSLQLDISLSEAFYKWMLHTEDTFTAQDLQVALIGAFLTCFKYVLSVVC
jgi:hypothetical protein